MQNDLTFAQACAAAGIPVGAALMEHLDGPVRDPRLDAYLSGMGVFLSHQRDPGQGVISIVRPTVPGLKEHHRKMGFAASLQISSAHPFEPLTGDGFEWEWLGNRWLYASYPMPGQHNLLVTPEVHRQLYSKAELQRKGELGSVPVVPGAVAQSRQELLAAISRLGLPLIMKRESGSGSDFVYSLNQVKMLDAGLAYLFGEAPGTDFPDPVIVQQNVYTNPYLGDWEVVGSYCLTAFVGPETEFILGVSEQAIERHSDGREEWLGSKSVYPEGEALDCIEDAFSSFARMCRKEGFIGAVGPDLFLIRHCINGIYQALFFDPNIRLPISAISFFVGAVTGLPFWQNMNVTLPEALGHFDQIERWGLNQPWLTWLASRSVVNPLGEVTEPSQVIKVFVGGTLPEELEARVRELKQKGVRIGT